jgi:hypothetical protein
MSKNIMEKIKKTLDRNVELAPSKWDIEADIFLKKRTIEKQFTTAELNAKLGID